MLETLAEVLATRGVPIPPPAAANQPLQAYQILGPLVALALVAGPARAGARHPALDGHAGRLARRGRHGRAPRGVVPGRPRARPVPRRLPRPGAHQPVRRVHRRPRAGSRGARRPRRLAGGRARGRAAVYQRNQVHVASFHPVALALWGSGPAETPLYPPRPARGLRRAHVADRKGGRGRGTSRGCTPRAGGRLAAGLSRARNLAADDHVAAALAGEPALRDLVGAALAAPRTRPASAPACPAGRSRRTSCARSFARM